METLWRKNPFSTLRRTKSHLSPTAPNTRPLSMGDLDALTSDIQGAGFIKSQSAQLTPLPNVARSGHGTTQGVSDSVQSTVEPRWTYSVADCNSTVTLTPQTTCMPHSSSTHSEGRNTLPRPSSPLSDSSSISTLTKSDTNLGQRWPSDPPNPVGANYGHQTCSSVESEGFGSYTSEELTLDDLIHQDWGQWAKEVRKFTVLTHPHPHTHTHAHTHTSTHAHTHTHTTHTHTHTCTSPYIVHTHAHTHMHTHTHARTRAHTHTHIHTTCTSPIHSAHTRTHTCTHNTRTHAHAYTHTKFNDTAFHVLGSGERADTHETEIEQC